LEHCFKNFIEKANIGNKSIGKALGKDIIGDKNIFYGHFVPALRGFADELTEEQRHCLNETFLSNNCEVKKAMMSCTNAEQGWDCLAQIPQVEHCRH
jgi:hypothetical protein